MTRSEHRQKTGSAILWNFCRVLIQTSASFIVGIILARLLSPESFGLIAIALFFGAFSELLSTAGVAAAVVQRKQLSSTHIEGALMFSLCMGVVFMLIFWFASEYIAIFFAEPILENIIKTLSVGMFFSTATSVQRGLLIREMDFKQLTKLDTIGYLIGFALVSIVLVFLDYGVWSLVLGNLIWMILTAVLLFCYSTHANKYRWHTKEIGELLRFGIGISLNNFIFFLVSRTTPMLIGKSLGAAQLGLYNRSNQLSGMPLKKIAATFSSVLFSSYSSIQNEQDLLSQEYHRSLRAVSILSLPVLSVAIAAGDYVIVGLLGDKWAAAVPVFQLLCLGAIFSNILHIAGAVVQATGHVYLEVKRQVVSLVILVLGSSVALQYGLLAFVCAQIVSSLSLYFMMAHLAIKILNSNWKDYFYAQLPGVFMSILVSGTTVLTIMWIEHSLNIAAPTALLIIGISAGVSYVTFLASGIIPGTSLYRQKLYVILAEIRKKITNFF